MSMKLIRSMADIKSGFSSSIFGASNTKVLVLGHQKSGTTVIANLIAEAANFTYANDPIYHTDRNSTNLLSLLYRDSPGFYEHVYKHKNRFFYNVVKDPDFSFSMKVVTSIYPNSHYLFVARNPVDIIRSIFNRLGLKGTLVSNRISIDELKNGTKQWEYILNGDKGDNYSVIERLAHRIERTTRMYKENSSIINVLKYEDFLLDKKKFIESCCSDMSITVKNDISDKLNKEFQPRGDFKVNPLDFFGEENLFKIQNICRDSIDLFGY